MAELASALLDCGAVLSQMIAGMDSFAASGRAAPDAAPVPDIAHDLVASVLADRLRGRHSKRDIRVAATIVAEAAEGLCEDLFVVDDSLFDAVAAREDGEEEDWDGPDGDEPGAHREPMSEDEIMAALTPLGELVGRPPGDEAVQRADPAEHIADFVRELLRVGLMLHDMAATMIEDMPADAYPGEDPGRVVLEMISGTIETEIGDDDPGQVSYATQMIGRSADRVIEHLRLALALSRRMHGEDGQGRGYG